MKILMSSTHSMIYIWYSSKKVNILYVHFYGYQVIIFKTIVYFLTENQCTPFIIGLLDGIFNFNSAASDKSPHCLHMSL